MESDSEKEKAFTKLRSDIKAENFHRSKIAEALRMEGKGSHDPIYSNSKKNGKNHYE